MTRFFSRVLDILLCVWDTCGRVRRDVKLASQRLVFMQLAGMRASFCLVICLPEDQPHNAVGSKPRLSFYIVCKKEFGNSVKCLLIESVRTVPPGVLPEIDA